MKNLMMWIHPDKKFDDETKTLVKIQIDNSRELGWKDKDIMLFTNFDYEYGVIKANVIGDDAYCDYMPIGTKITTLFKLFDQGYIKKHTVYWMHDFDCYQLIPFKKNDIILGKVDMALCDYGRKKNKWSGGSIFFKSSAKDIFEKQLKIMTEHKCVDETALYSLTTQNPDIHARIKKLDSAYHFLPFNIKRNYRNCLKPLRIAHFHPLKSETRILQTPDENLFQWYCGNNKINTQLIPDRLIKIFKKHGTKE